MPAPNATIDAIGQTNGIAGLTQTGRGGILARTGVGTYTLTLDRDLDITDGTIELTDQGAAAPASAVFQIVHTSDLVKTITRYIQTNAAAYAQPALTDGAFSWIVHRYADLSG